MTREELIEKTKACNTLANELCKEGICDVITAFDGDVHCNSEVFVKIAGDTEYQIEKRNDSKYPLKITVYMDGIVYFAIGDIFEIIGITNAITENKEIKKATEVAE